jgi:hypothetical protein
MNNPLTENIQTDLDQAIAEILVNDLVQEIQSKQPGHRIQVTDIPAALMERVCQQLPSFSSRLIYGLQQKILWMSARSRAYL